MKCKILVSIPILKLYEYNNVCITEAKRSARYDFRKLCTEVRDLLYSHGISINREIVTIEDIEVIDEV